MPLGDLGSRVAAMLLLAARGAASADEPAPADDACNIRSSTPLLPDWICLDTARRSQEGAIGRIRNAVATRIQRGNHRDASQAAVLTEKSQPASCGRTRRHFS